MQLQCTLDQAEAIRRGYNATSTVKIDVDIATLTQAERDEIAACFKDGKYEVTYPTKGRIYTIPEPTVNGLRETLEKNIVAHAKYQQEKQEREQKEAAEKREKIEKWRKKFDADPQSCIVKNECTAIYPNNYHINVSSGDRSEYLDESRRAIFDATVATLVTKAKKDAAEREQKEAAAKAAKEKAVEDLRQWSITHGSELLRLRAEEEMNWEEMAAKEYGLYLLEGVGIKEPTIQTPEGYEWEGSDFYNDGTAEEIKKFRRIREAVAKIEGITTKVEMESYLYKKISEYEEDEEIMRSEIWVRLDLPSGKSPVFYFTTTD